MIIIRANDPQRTDLSGWRVRGMRASVSGTYDCAGIDVTKDSWLGNPGDYGREPRFTAGAWRFCAVQLGGIDALIEETAMRMHPKARADTALRQRFANAYVAACSARFWVQEAARKASCEAGDAITAARIARGVVEDAIVTNANRFRRKWGVWPMGGWLEQFERLGLIEWQSGSARLRCNPRDDEFGNALSTWPAD